MSSNGAVGCPEDMQVESTHENSLNILDKTSDKPKTLTNNITDISGKTSKYFIIIYRKKLYIFGKFFM